MKTIFFIFTFFLISVVCEAAQLKDTIVDNDLTISTAGTIIFEGTTADGFETILTVEDPTTPDKTITLPNATGTVVLKDSTDILTDKTINADNNTISNIGSAEITNDSIVNADINSAAAIEGSKIVDATTSVEGSTEHATAAETTTGTDAGRSVTPDGLAGSDYGKRYLAIAIFDGDIAVTVADGKVGIPITAEFNGWNIVDVQANVRTKGVTGATDIQIRRQRGAADVDVLSTKITIGDEYYASDEVINTSNDDLVTGDMIFVDRDAVHSGTAPNGLSVVVIIQLP